MTYQPPQTPYPYQPPRKRRHVMRTVGLVSFAGLVAIIAITIGASGGNKNGNDPGGTAPAKSPGVSRGLGARDASADVTLTSCGDEQIPGVAEGLIAITNHSSKRSDYVITIVYLAADGAQVGDGLATATAVEGGQKARAQLIATTSGTWTKCKITEVERTASV